MNYLAHLYLASCFDNDSEHSQEQKDEIIIGNFLGDFVKGKLDAHKAPELRLHGIRQHRAIDRLADDSCGIFLNTPNVEFQHRRFAGICFDVACDHFLAKNWHEFSDENLKGFSERLLSLLLRSEDSLPERAKFTLDRMIRYDWLNNYEDLGFIENVFLGISNRFPRENAIDKCHHDLVNHYEEFENHFNDFMPKLIDFSADFSKS